MPHLSVCQGIDSLFWAPAHMWHRYLFPTLCGRRLRPHDAWRYKRSSIHGHTHTHYVVIHISPGAVIHMLETMTLSAAWALSLDEFDLLGPTDDGLALSIVERVSLTRPWAMSQPWQDTKAWRRWPGIWLTGSLQVASAFRLNFVCTVTATAPVGTLQST